MILVSGSIADFIWTLEAAWLAVCRHHVLLGSKPGQTHRLSYTHIHTPAPSSSSDPETCDRADMGPGYPAEISSLGTVEVVHQDLP